jgi:hypothetical protein
MHISIWQQFASNHSNSFIVIGRFETLPQAQDAYFAVHDVLQRLREGYLTTPYSSVRLPADEYAYSPTPVDIEVFKPFGIVPHKMIDWISFEDEFVDEVTQLYDSRIYISAFGYSGYAPFDLLLGKLGATVDQTEDFEPGAMAVDIECTAQDSHAASQIYEGLQAKDSEALPWLEFLGGKRHSDPSQLKNREAAYLVWQNWANTLAELKREYIKTPRWQRPPFAPRIQEWEQNPPAIAEPDRAIREEISHARAKVCFQRDHARFTINERVVRCRNLLFDYQHIGVGLPAILQWMRSLGCEVDYSFHRIFLKVQIIARAPSEERAEQVARELGSDPSTQLKVRLGPRDTIEANYDILNVTLYSPHAAYDEIMNLFHEQKFKKIRRQWTVDDMPT